MTKKTVITLLASVALFGSLVLGAQPSPIAAQSEEPAKVEAEWSTPSPSLEDIERAMADQRSLEQSDAPASIQANGAITGIVTAADTGLPVSSVFVTAYDSSGAFEDIDIPNSATGVYSLTVAPGQYKIEFEPYIIGSNYAIEWFDNQPDFTSATPVNVAEGAVTPNINAALDIGGRITGIMTAQENSAPLKDVRVKAYLYDTCEDPVEVRAANTDASGAYTITGLFTGVYRIRYDSSSSGDSAAYFSEYYDDKPSFAAADPVTATLGMTTTGINAALRRASLITGRVTADDGGAGLDDVNVTVYDSIGNAVGTSYTDAGGVYTITNLSAGSYRLQFRPLSFGATAAYLAEFYNDKAALAQADAINVPEAGIVSGIDARLKRGGAINGRVTAADSSLPLEDVEAVIYDGNGSYVTSRDTDANGAYSILGLPTGNYRLLFRTRYVTGAARAYMDEYFNDKPSLAAADVVNVTAGSVINGIDAALTRGGQITGRVIAADSGNPLQSVFVAIYESNSRSYVGFGATDASGAYASVGLPSGSYKLEFDTDFTSGVAAEYFSEYYNDKASLAEADPVVVTQPNVTVGINAVLARSGKISGRVTAGNTGEPLSGVTVSAEDGNGVAIRTTSTNATGNYTLTRLPTNDYRVRFHSGKVITPGQCASTARLYLGEYFNDKPSFPMADIVSVIAPNAVTGIDAALEGGGIVRDTYLPVARR